jgi:hypothetical protein
VSGYIDPLSGRPIWEHEPDYEWFSAAGLVCVVRRHDYFKHLCGYVGVNSSHPLYEVDRCDMVPAPSTWRERTIDIDEHGAIDTFFAFMTDFKKEIPAGFAPLNMLIGVHGGITWSDRLHDHTGWWFGFDCGHAGDFQPGMVEAIEAMGHDASFLHDFSTYRTFGYVKQECATLAQQLADYGNDGSADELHKVILAMRKAARP